jgi:hypothetical protein
MIEGQAVETCNGWIESGRCLEFKGKAMGLSHLHE